MTPARVLAVAVLALVLLASASVALAAGRVALVVGNSTYTHAHIARLPNPENDAADIAAALQRLGFDVTTVQDADRASLNEALRVFTHESVGADMALVFYAGHGLEMDGVNYLVPVDARLERDTDVRFETVALDDVLAATAGASLRMVILDACRNNPLARLDAANGGSSKRERRQLRGPERGPAGGRDAGGLCGGGGDPGRRRPGPEQPVHGCPAGASGGASRAERLVPPDSGAGAGVHGRSAATARVRVSAAGALPERPLRAGAGCGRRGRRGGGAAAAGDGETPTRAELARFDRSRKDRKTSNKEWQSPQDPDAKIAKMKDGWTHLAHKAEHGVDLETGAILSVTVQDASEGDSATLPETLTMAAEQVEAVQPAGAEVEEVVADKGYHSDATLVALDEIAVRSYVYAAWLSEETGARYRLPSEAEWEYAARRIAMAAAVAGTRSARRRSAPSPPTVGDCTTCRATWMSGCKIAGSPTGTTSAHHVTDRRGRPAGTAVSA